MKECSVGVTRIHLEQDREGIFAHAVDPHLTCVRNTAALPEAEASRQWASPSGYRAEQQREYLKAKGDVNGEGTEGTDQGKQ